jgi:hypothetical protein
MPKGQFRGLRTGGKRNTTSGFIRTRGRNESTKPNFPLRRKVNKHNYNLTHIASNKKRAKQLADQERKKGKNAIVISGRKIKQGPRLFIESGLKLGRSGVYTKPKKKTSRKKK